jgi:quercetin dioxygenase-like cupin family protein
MARAILIAAFALLASASHAQVNPSELRWGPAPPGLPPGAKLAVLAGNPGQAGPFVIRVRFPPGYTVRPHHHPADEHVTVISGDLAVGMGDRYNPRRMKQLRQGGFVDARTGMNHYVSTRGGGIVQINSVGPFEIVYANPADDPRRRR